MAVWQTVARAYGWLVGALAVVAGAAVGAACAMIVVDVSIRTAGYPPPHFTIAIVEYGLLYITMFAAPYLVRTRGHVYIDALISRLPAPVEWACAKIAYVVGLVAALTFAWLSLGLFLDAWASGFVEERGVDMPLWTLYLPIPIGCSLIAVELLRFLFGSELMHRSAGTTETGV